jgi:hypothetical protein
MTSAIFSRLMISREITSTLIYRALYIGCSSVLIFAIPFSLSTTELGYYFTFSSITALQIFFELGVSFVFLQFFSHLKAKIVINHSGLIEGDEYSLTKIKFYFDFLIKWYSTVSIVFLSTIPIFGTLFFNNQGDQPLQLWIYPWLWLCLLTSINIFLSAIISMFEGLGFLSEIAKLRSWNIVASFIVSIFLIVFDAGLYIVVCGPLCTLIFYLYWIYKKRKILTSIYKINKTKNFNWTNDILPYQWRISVSWLSGYFIFNALNPYIFYQYGPEISGKVGFCLSLFSAALTISSTWINASIPRLNHLISVGNRIELNKRFLAYFSLSAITYLTIFLTLFLIKYLSDMYNLTFSIKTIELPTFITIGTMYFIHLISGNLATYVRSHLVEPFVSVSLATATLFLFAASLKTESVISLFVMLNIISTLGLIYIFYYFKNYYTATSK